MKKRLDQLRRPTEMELRDWHFLTRKTLGSKFVKIDELEGFFKNIWIGLRVVLIFKPLIDTI